MAQARVKPTRPIDPNSPEAKEETRMLQDKESSTAEQSEKKEVRDDQVGEDAAKIIADKARHAQAAAAIEKKQADERAAYLKKRLSPEEREQYKSLVFQAKSGHPVDPTSMKMLGDFRIRLKNNGVENPE